MAYVIKQKQGTLTVIQEFTGTGNAKPKIFETYGEAHFFAENANIQGYLIEKIEDDKNDTREQL